MTAPMMAPKRAYLPEGMPFATCTRTVPGHAPESARPRPRIAPPITFPSYVPARPSGDGLRGCIRRVDNLLCIVKRTLNKSICQVIFSCLALFSALTCWQHLL